MTQPNPRKNNNVPQGYRRLLLAAFVCFLIPNGLISTTTENNPEEITFLEPSQRAIISGQNASSKSSSTRENPTEEQQHVQTTAIQNNCEGPSDCNVSLINDNPGSKTDVGNTQQAFVDPTTLHWKFPVANSTNEMNFYYKRAIFLLSMGQDAAKSVLVERILLSIRKRGLFLGPVVVLTDAPVDRYKWLTSVDPNFMVLHPRPEDWRLDLLQDMPYKRFKTFILDYLDRLATTSASSLKSLELVYYLDIDVVVGKPLQEWFDHVERTYVFNDAASHHPSKMVFFQGNLQHGFPVQGGQFVLQRNVSQACLDRWRYYIDSYPNESKDQHALSLMLKEQQDSTNNNNHCHLTIMPQHPWLYFLSRNAMTRILDNTQEYSTLMHIKNSHHATMIPDKKQKKFFAKLLELSSPEEIQVMGKVRIRPNRTWSSIRRFEG